MNIDEFWQLIDKTRIESSNNPKQQAKLLEDALYEMAVKDIIDYENIHDALMDRAYRMNLCDVVNMISSAGDDGFTDFRAWLIAQGREVYADVLQNPEFLTAYVSLDKRHKIREELLGYVAHEAYNKKTGTDEGVPQSEMKQVDLGMGDLPPDKNCWYIGDIEETDKCLQKLYPKTWKKFGGYL